MAAADISAQDFWALPRGERDAVFTALRRDDPLSWHETPESVLVPPELTTGGYWAVVRYDDVRHVRRRPPRLAQPQALPLRRGRALRGRAARGPRGVAVVPRDGRAPPHEG